MCSVGKKYVDRGFIFLPGFLHSIQYRHSQTTRIPSCPSSTRKLWEGYSFLSMTGSERAHVNDLASPGSCLQLFNPIPFMFCEKQENCYYAQRNDRSYWLSTEEEPMMWNPVPANETQRHISRCVVCEAPSKVLLLSRLIMMNRIFFDKP